MAGVNAYKDKVVTRLYKGLTGLVASRQIEVIEGTGRLVSPTVGPGRRPRSSAARHVVLATGSESRSLPGLAIDGNRVITSDHALTLDHVPASVVVLGGGVIGVEFASVWRSFGAEVTIVEALPHLLPLRRSRAPSCSSARSAGAASRFKLGTRFESVKDTGDGVTVTLEGGKTIDAELLLVAVGRGPVSAGLGYDEVGVAMDRGFVLVDEPCRTNIPTISRVGDVRPGLQLAHVGFGEGILVAERLAGLTVVPIDYDGVPRITYSHPRSPRSASPRRRPRHARHRVHRVHLRPRRQRQEPDPADQRRGKGHRDGQAAVRRSASTWSARRVGDLIAEAQLIVNWEAVPNDVAQLIHPHPTQSEAIGEAHLALAGKPLHIHG